MVVPDRFVPKNNYAKRNVRRIREIFDIKNMLSKNKIIDQDILYNNEYIQKRKSMSKQEIIEDNNHVHFKDI